ncbi:hypothetical protein L873DRAFT_1840421 [Choiromyces venosus 120613-1]|uniref:Uncharacterized protein n=1 Tax=Choiromyces venosus 120613-1 TaxID=1336337 RepID=A0A3N4KFR7_9PEZI|nr:hypothetical protein L873DRAFT_1840421 [Choiromyces venosus 120613-1]
MYLCYEQHLWFQNSIDLEEEKHRVEESFLCLHQKSSQSLEKYIKVTRKIAHERSSENQHLGASQFVKWLDLRELQVQAMSEMANRPTIEEAIMKVRYLHDVIESQGTDGFRDETEESESKSESEGNNHDDRDDNGYSRQEKRKGGKGKGYFQEYRKMKKGSRKKRDKKQLKGEKIMQELEELKQLLKWTQRGNQIASNSCRIILPWTDGLPTLEAYTATN